MNPWVKALSLAATVGGGLIAGTFFIFSVVIMPVLAKGSADQGIQMMRSINEVILRSPFMPVFGATALISLILPFMAGLQRSPLTLAACLLFLVGVFGVTMFGNVPLNDQLMVNKGVWPTYLSVWTLWNHVRTIAGIVSMSLLILALRD